MAATPPQTSFLATRRGKLTLALLAAVAFLDFVDAVVALRATNARGGQQPPRVEVPEAAAA
jgi:hypothetical protein